MMPGPDATDKPTAAEPPASSTLDELARQAVPLFRHPGGSGVTRYTMTSPSATC
jgi:hypothetical protein